MPGSERTERNRREAKALERSLTPISVPRAATAFDRLSSLGCDPCRVRAGCIPFVFPDDGCHARAHLMCAVLVHELGIECGKIWLYGRAKRPYRVSTPNHPTGRVRWLYHVAPVVRTTGGLRVIDPSLFDGIVTCRRWSSRQFAGGIVVLSDRHVFDRLRPGARIQRDPTLRRTARVLGTVRAKLIERAGEAGPQAARAGATLRRTTA